MGNHPRPRIGKTAKDRKSGATERRLSNRSARTIWQQTYPSIGFPRESCNGKKNRYRTTGKNNTVLFC